ncbi:hypothetical protein INR49_021376, partial [Caranx melampygus]
CGNTNWSGRYVRINENAHGKWCEPTNSTLEDTDRVIKTEWWFSVSQIIGLSVVLGVIGVIVVMWICDRKGCCKAPGEVPDIDPPQHAQEIELLDFRASQSDLVTEATRELQSLVQSAAAEEDA